MTTDTASIAAEPADVEALLDTLTADINDDPDPLTRYLALTGTQALLDAAVSAVKSRRGVELRRMADAGASYDEIARATGLGGKQRVSQLIERPA